jgi:1,4-alpha-glucan branching enzyme
MSVKKQFLKSKPVCKVTFKVSKEQANNAKKVFVVGDFNKWSEKKDKMNPLKDGSFTLTIDLKTGREYEFRYLADGNNWITETEADKLVPSGFGDAQNSVIVV